MNTPKQAKRFVSVRLTEEEFREVYRQCESSTCRSLTEYVKKVLTKKPVTVKVRNQSQDELLQTMVGIKNRLDQLTAQAEGSNPAGLAERPNPAILREISEIKSLTRKIAEKWLQ